MSNEGSGRHQSDAELDRYDSLLKTNNMLSKTLCGFILSFLTVSALTPLFGKIAVRLGILDRPEDPSLKIHRKPIPYLGGASLFVALALSSYLFGSASYPFLGAMTLIFLLGLLDDIHGLPPGLRLTIEAIAAFLFLYTVRDAGPILMGLFFLLTLATVNSVNLIDGLDGLASGTAAVASAGFAIISLISGNHQALLLSVALIGATTAFLFYNFHPARIFLGDAGSYLLGFLLAVLLILTSSDLRSLVASLFFLGIFGLDTSLAIVRRLVNGRPIFQGDRSHLYDQIMDRTGSHRRAVFMCYLLESLFVVAGLLAFWLPGIHALIFFFLFWSGVWVMLKMTNFIKVERTA
ncbi:MAG: undecaprenyl/decaprenyl-phosphate alpha-N-acetylglucosaminyl 1-phosphate transferase [Candidatus Hydrothermae bacterium]|nr:undecaprenyl/decaprenyl-phosphate alpha-N-acetylglucosaminyl 1-phosphate transferase [Candidatus Hydrothermae bacterium]